jgi:CheY-like chemotaxis protein
MGISALVMSRSNGAVKVLVAAFAELGIEYKVSASVPETLEILATEHHSALIVDFDLPDATCVAKMARSLPEKRRPVLFGMIGAATSVGSAFQAGANFVLYKALEPQQVLHSFRAARGFMHGDRRSATRQKGEALAYLQFPTGILPALVMDVTEQGLSLQAAEGLTPLRGVVRVRDQRAVREVEHGHRRASVARSGLRDDRLRLRVRGGTQGERGQRDGRQARVA